MANPEATKEVLLFPDSQWELYRWNKRDLIGFPITAATAFVAIGILVASVKRY